jgi:hypothetical protein
VRVTVFGLSRSSRRAPARFREGRFAHFLRDLPRQALWVIAVALNLSLIPNLGKGQVRDDIWPFHSPTPAGYSVVLLQPSRTELALFGLIECPQMEGVQRVARGMNASLISAEGLPVKEFPRQLSFRVTATLRKILQEEPSETVSTDYDPREFLLKLGFKLKIYHGLDRRSIFPQSVKNLGMPGDLPYDERIFRVNFDLENVPVTDRLVLEILSPHDEVLAHFTFGLL